MIKNKLELYLHIPFCVRKCAYCDFLSGVQNEDVREAYVNALVREIHMQKGVASRYVVDTIFVGGGTPSVLNAQQIARIFHALQDTFEIDANAEITIEANPGTVSLEKLMAYRQCGINRISFGLQSANDEELKLLGRIHTYKEFLESFDMAREAGFENINVDLISAIPKQTLDSWENTLQKVIALEPEHISAYSLIIEEGTPFATQYGEGAAKEDDLPDEDTERSMYYRTEELLQEAGYERYEISNYAKAGKACRHNLGYWERKEYLGLGIGAASLMDEERYRNTNDLAFYIANSDCLDRIQEEWEVLSKTAQMEEFFFLGLRKMSGVSMQEFADTYRITVEKFCGDKLEKLIADELLETETDRLRLTKQGIDVSNYVFSELLRL